ncbi:dynein axonemal heavy chain 5-like [Amia ocellicauda]|uniref:dynein axonemal heavy chain 5-like n=1 Tax=Amia ocellicauda TaxID=2972642 RepID=UPI0034640BFD
MWARTLFRNIELTMNVLKNKPAILKVPEMRKIIRSYNRIAEAMLEYELDHHRVWCQVVEFAPSSLGVSLLVRHPETKELCVNLDPLVLLCLREARYLQRMGLEVPEVLLGMCAREARLKAQQIRLQDMLQDFQEALNKVPDILQPVMQPFVMQVDEALSPGLTMLTWTSLDIERFIDTVYGALEGLQQMGKWSGDALECRVERVLQAMCSTALLDLSDEQPVEPLSFQDMAERVVAAAGRALSV